MIICPECGNPLVVRRGRYGEFVACSNYPECKYIKSNKAPKEEPIKKWVKCCNVVFHNYTSNKKISN